MLYPPDQGTLPDDGIVNVSVTTSGWDKVPEPLASIVDPPLLVKVTPVTVTEIK